MAATTPRAAAGALAALVLVAPALARSAVFEVTILEDANDGACDARCSLRDAVLAANATPGEDTILLGPGTYVLTLGGYHWDDDASVGDLDLLDDVRIVGAGADATIVDGSDALVPFSVHENVHAVIDGVTIARGRGVGATGAPGAIGIAGQPATAARTRLDLLNSTVRDSAGALGGGIGSFFATVVVENCTFVGNSAAIGSGIANRFGTVVVVNSTFTGNTGQGTIANAGDAERGRVTISSSTIAGNLPGDGTTAGLLAETRSTDGVPVAAITLKGTIVSAGAAAACLLRSSGRAEGVIRSGGYNLVSDGTCRLAGTADRAGIDPALGPLAANGGPTETLLPAPASAAVDAIPPSDCTDALGRALVRDQRGAPRPEAARGRCDVGAAEAQGVEAAAPDPGSALDAGAATAGRRAAPAR